MSLSKRVVTVPLVGGLSDNDDNFASDPPGWIEIENARWARDKQIGKRNGIVEYNFPGDGGGGPGPSSSPIVLAPDLNQIVDLDGVAHALTAWGTYRHEIGGTSPTRTWTPMNAGAPQPTRAVSDPLVRVNAGCAKSDAAIGGQGGNIVAAVWDQVTQAGAAATAYYGLWETSTDVPRPLAGPFRFTNITQAVRVVSLSARYFIFAGLTAARALYVCAYDSTTFTMSAEVLADTIDTSMQFALAPNYTQSGTAYLAYLKNGSVRQLRTVSTAGALGTAVALSAGGVQHVLHNGVNHKVAVIGPNGDIDYIADTLTGAVTNIQPFTDPASGMYTGRWFRASIGMSDKTPGGMWAARSTSGPHAIASNAPVATQFVKLDETFAAHGLNLVGGIVLSAHFSPFIDGSGCSFVGVAAQGAWFTKDYDPTLGVTGEAYKAAPVGFLASLVQDDTGLVQPVFCARYGQDAMELFGNALGVSTPAVVTATAHLPHLSINLVGGGRKIVTAYPVRTSDYLGGTPTSSYKRSIDLAQITVYASPPTRNVQAQGLRILGGGFGVTAIDGLEHAELTPPNVEWLVMSGFGAAAGNTYGTLHINTTGTPWDGAPNPNRQWGFVVFWQYTDARGNVHRGQPSSIRYTLLGELVDVGGHGGKLCLAMPRPTALLGDKGVSLELAVYGCPYDGNGDFRQLGIVTPAVDPADEGRVFVTITNGGAMGPNDVALSVWDFGSSLSPQNAAPRSLYTMASGGGELPAEPPPAMLSLCSTQSRLWGLNAGDRLDVWYTKPLALGYAPEWSSSLRVRIPQEGGPAVGIAALDDKVVVFKASKIFVIEGDGGDAAGNASSLRVPRLVSGDIGCSAVESIVEGPFGVFFQSVRGFFTLDRGLSYQFVGKDTMDQLSGVLDGDTYTVTSAAIVPAESEVRITSALGDISGVTTRGIAWNYLRNKWCRRTQGESFISLVDGLVWSGFAGSLNGGGNQIWRETPADWTSAPYAMTMRSSWIKLNGIAGFGRVWRCVFLFRWFGEHGIRITTAQDYLPSTETAKLWTASDLTALYNPTDNRLELVVCPKVQKCEAIQFLIEEYDGQGILGGRGFELIGVTLEVGVKPTAYKRLPAAARK